MQDITPIILSLAGGAGNIAELDNCLTRVRLIVKDEGLISAKAGKDLEAQKYTPVVHGKNIHVIVGTKAGDYRKALETAIKAAPLGLAEKFLAAAGGAGNIAELDNCLTRVRLTVKDERLLSPKEFKALEKQGFPSVINGLNVHIIAGKAAIDYTRELKKLLPK